MMLTKQYYVYFLANWNNKVIYVGVTNDLKRRVHEHKYGLIEGFTRKYHVNKLVYYEVCEEIAQTNSFNIIELRKYTAIILAG